MATKKSTSGAAKPQYDLLIKNVRVVRPGAALVEQGDIAIKGGRFAKIAPVIAADMANLRGDAAGGRLRTGEEETEREEG